jgi:outer membrane protein assembly factor BamB
MFCHQYPRIRSLSFAILMAVTVAGAFVAKRAEAQQPSNGPVKFQRCWSFAVSGAGGEAVFVDDRRVILRVPGGIIRSLSLKNGQEEWSTDLGGEVISNIIGAGDRYLAVSASRSANGTSEPAVYLRSISADSGLVGIQVRLPFAEGVSLAAVDDRVIAAGADGSIAAFTLEGKPIWNFLLAGGITVGPEADDSGLLLGTGERRIYRIAAATGETLARFVHSSSPVSLGRDEDGVIFVGDERGRVARLAGESGDASWTFKSGGRVDDVVFSGDRVIVSSVDNFVYAIDRGTGNVEWKKRLAGRVLGDPLVTSDSVIAVVHGEGSATIIAAGSGKVRESIVFGPDIGARSAPLASPSGHVVFTLSDRIAAYHNTKCTQ